MWISGGIQWAEARFIFADSDSCHLVVYKTVVSKWLEPYFVFTGSGCVAYRRHGVVRNPVLKFCRWGEVVDTTMVRLHGPGRICSQHRSSGKVIDHPIILERKLR
jgi:hypothetical protein